MTFCILYLLQYLLIFIIYLHVFYFEIKLFYLILSQFYNLFLSLDMVYFSLLVFQHFLYFVFIKLFLLHQLLNFFRKLIRIIQIQQSIPLMVLQSFQQLYFFVHIFIVLFSFLYFCFEVHNLLLFI